MFFCISLMAVGSIRGQGESPCYDDLGEESSVYIVQMYLAGNAIAQRNGAKEFQDVETYFGTISMTEIYDDCVILETKNYYSDNLMQQSSVSIPTGWKRRISIDNNLHKIMSSFLHHYKLGRELMLDDSTTITVQESENNQMIEVRCKTWVNSELLEKIKVFKN